MYKKAAELKLRFDTSRGSLSTEQLMDLPVRELDKIALELEEAYKSSGRKSFLVKSTAKDKVAKLKFNLALDILTTKVETADALKDAGAIKAHNTRIDELIARKQDEELGDKSIKELEKMRK